MTMYALYEAPIEVINDCIQLGIDYGSPELVTSDPLEITVQVGGCEWDDDHYCIEIYEADEFGEFVSGSDFDTPTHFYQQHDPDPDGCLKEVG